MNNTRQIYLISDSTGETLDRIFLALQSQFPNFKHKIHQYSFIRTANQLDKILSLCDKNNSVILYTVVDEKLTKHLVNESKKRNIPCFGILGELINIFSQLLNQKATHKQSAQHILDDGYYKRMEAIQFTMQHDDGKVLSDINESDIILLGVSRTSKTPTSIYLANRGFKTCNIPIIIRTKLPDKLLKNPKISCVVGFVLEPQRLLDIRKNRMNLIYEKRSISYTNIDYIVNELDESKKIFKKYNWPILDVTRKSVEEVAASVIKIYGIMNNK